MYSGRGNADMEILEAPVELADFLGEKASALPEGLAIFLVDEDRDGDTYAVYSRNLKVEDGKAQFDLKLKDETVILMILSIVVSILSAYINQSKK